ncbi:uncharacterized protein [Coffea arabica]|uniref:Homeobox domain-containing protein n=1 Tax=Coffea arabica TaxID=13443 RepID=A0ABM4U5J1_COFAR
MENMDNHALNSCTELEVEVYFGWLYISFRGSICIVLPDGLQVLRTFREAFLDISNAWGHGITSLSSFLSHHPYLSSLSLTDSSSSSSSFSSHHLLQSVAFSCPNLRHLRFFAEPVSGFSLLSLSNSCPHLSSLTITLSRPLCFQWLAPLRALKELSVFIIGSETELFSYNGFASVLDVELNLESLSLCGSRGVDYGLNFLWRNCKKLEKLKLKSCECVGDNVSFSAFIKGLETLKEMELRTSRTLADGVLLKLAEGSVSLSSLLVDDGGTKVGSLQLISQCRADVQKLDLRLPLDLDNDHLIAVAENFENEIKKGMEYEKQKQHQEERQKPQLLMEGQNIHGGNLNNGDDMFVKVMTDEQMEILGKQIAAYATICEQLEDLHRALISQNDPSHFMLRNPYLTPLMTTSSLHRIPRRQRWNPTAQQLQILERVFDQGNETPSKEKVKDITAELAKHGQISESNVYNWFQNRRARMKKKQVVVEKKKTEPETQMVTESSLEEGEKLKPSEPMIEGQNYCVQKVSAGNSIFSFDEQGMEMQQPLFAIEGFHRGMSSDKAKIHYLLEDMDVNPPGCYDPYIHAE